MNKEVSYDDFIFMATQTMSDVLSTITFARFGRESINKDHVKFIRLVLLNLTNNMIMNFDGIMSVIEWGIKVWR